MRKPATPTHDVIPDGTTPERVVVLSTTVVGWDLQLVKARRTDSVDTAASIYRPDLRAGSIHAQLFDTSGNYLTTLAAYSPDAPPSEAEWTALLATARAMFPTHADYDEYLRVDAA